ncbi:MAG: RimK family alpha-L-glutamate ligase [Planctomycetaceae bacterium]
MAVKQAGLSVRIAVIGNAGSWYGAALEHAAKSRKCQVSRVDFQDIRTADCLPDSAAVAVSTADLTQVDAVVVRTMPPGSLEQVVFRMDALAQLEAQGVQVVNSAKAIECAVDKYLTTTRLRSHGLPVPPTAVCQTAEVALELFQRLGGDVVVKPLFGAEGRGLMRISDIDLADRAFRTLERLQSVIYLQQFIDHGGSDIRVLVWGNDVLGGMRRVCHDGFRTNIAQQGTAQRHVPTDNEVELACRAAATTFTRFAGVDLMYGSDGRCMVVEVNAVPGWRMFQRVVGGDVAGQVIDRLLDERKRSSSIG